MMAWSRRRRERRKRRKGFFVEKWCPIPNHLFIWTSRGEEWTFITPVIAGGKLLNIHHYIELHIVETVSCI
jgi:hypothetical protein